MDALGRPRQIARSGLSDTLDLDYDKSGNLTSLLPPGKPTAHSFSYDAMDREETYTPPGVAGGGLFSKNEYTNDGYPKKETTSGGRVFLFSYNDPKKRLKEIQINASGLAQPSSYTLALGYDAQQRLQSLSDSSGESLSFAYTGTLLRKVTSSGTVNGSVGFDYDPQFRVVAEKVNDTSVVSYGYDNDGMLRTASLQGAELRFVRNVKGQVQQSVFSLNGNLSTAVVETYTYDPAYGDLLGIEATRNNELLYRYTIEQRDNLGREKIRREAFNSPVGVQETRLRYDYDAAGRLSKVFSCPLVGDTSCTANPTEVASYAYDDNGNLTAYPGFFNPTYDAQDRLLSTSTTTFSNNAEGWRTGSTFSVFSHTYTYHPTGHLLATQGQQGTASYRLDPLGRRIERATSSSTSRFLYRDALRPAAELTASNALRTRFVYASGRNVPDFLWRDGSFFRILTDPRGSVRVVVNVATGAVEQRMRQDAWGRVEEDTAAGWQPFGYAGGLYEPMTGMVRFGAREYDPATARWLQKDPIRFAGGDSNLYAYVAGDPVNYIDPNGLWLLQATGVVFGAGAQAWTNYNAYSCGRISGEDYATLIVMGAFVGLLGTIPTSVVGGAIVGGLGSGFNEALNSGAGAKPSSLEDFVKAVGVGALAGGAANALGIFGNQFLKYDKIIGQTLPTPPLKTYGDLGGSFGIAIGTIWSNY
jgi:RHS repeat-associated protein